MTKQLDEGQKQLEVNFLNHHNFISVTPEWDITSKLAIKEKRLNPKFQMQRKRKNNNNKCPQKGRKDYNSFTLKIPGKIEYDKVLCSKL